MAVFRHTLSFSCLNYAGCAPALPPSALPALDGGKGGGRREEEEEEAESKREREKEEGAHGNGGMRRERFLSLPLFFVAVTGPQKQERVVHLQVAAVSSFIGWLWM